MLVPAIDLGGTYIKGALVSPAGAVSFPRTVPTRPGDGHQALAERLIELGRLLVNQAALVNRSAPQVIGVAVPGLVDTERGVVRQAANLGWADYPVGQILTEAIGCPVAIGHDVTQAALAEHRFGAAAGAELAIVAPIGTGIAACVIYQGQAIRGAHGGIVELGHLPLAGWDLPCGCGGQGCVERVGSASAIARRYAALSQTAGRTGQLDFSAEQVAQMAEQGDELARKVWQDAIDAIAAGLTTLITVFDPERIVIGGGLSQSGEQLLGPLRRELADRLTFQVMPQVVATTLGPQAGVIGAAMVAGL
ncbi:MAG: ROK family protein [Bifidobacteriaceae bacterium]|jgi:glucokinase|nr:ROK family protein [Bifidobacteriaceae bacterium]